MVKDSNKFLNFANQNFEGSKIEEKGERKGLK